MIKTYLKSYLYLFGLIFLLSIILSIINYLFSYTSNIFKILIPIISIFISSLILGKNTKEKAYLEGIKFSSLYLIIITIFKLIMNQTFPFKLVIIYFLIILTSIIGVILGINIKKG